MGMSWTEEEYAITDAAYEKAVTRKKRGGHVTRSEVVDECRKGLPERDPSSIEPHLGNLTAARNDLGLPILSEIAPFANRPEKLVGFVRTKYRVG